MQRDQQRKFEIRQKRNKARDVYLRQHRKQRYENQPDQADALGLFFGGRTGEDLLAVLGHGFVAAGGLGSSEPASSDSTGAGGGWTRGGAAFGFAGAVAASAGLATGGFGGTCCEGGVPAVAPGLGAVADALGLPFVFDPRIPGILVKSGGFEPGTPSPNTWFCSVPACLYCCRKRSASVARKDGGVLGSGCAGAPAVGLDGSARIL